MSSIFFQNPVNHIGGIRHAILVRRRRSLRRATWELIPILGQRRKTNLPETMHNDSFCYIYNLILPEPVSHSFHHAILVRPLFLVAFPLKSG